jgi:hypothetical protein
MHPGHALLILAFVAACGGGEEGGSGAGGGGGDGGGGEGAAAPGDVGVGEWACAPGELALGEACLAPGVPVDGCAAGFVAEDQGCTPTLAADCPAGLMAIPGDAACREVAPCGAGPWDGIPLEPNTVFVDASYPGNDSDGSQLKPYASLLAANAAAPTGALIAIGPGAYDTGPGGLNINKPLRLWGKCPAEVSIDGSANATIQFDGGSGSELHQVTVTGSFAVAVSPAANILLDRVHASANLAPVLVQNDAGQHGITSATVRDSLLVGGGAGVVALDADVTIERSMIRGQSYAIAELPGHAVQLSLNDPAGIGELVVRDSVLEDFELRAVATAGANVELDGVVVRRGGDGTTAVVDVAGHPISGALVQASLRRSVIHDVVGAGLDVIDGDLIVDALTVRDATAIGTEFFGGMFVAALDNSLAPVATIERSLFERLDGWGLGDASVDASLRSILVRDITPIDGLSWGASLGTGVVDGRIPAIAIDGMRIERSGVIGLQVVSADVDVTSLHVADLPGVVGVIQSGRGVSVSSLSGLPQSTTFVLRDSLIDRPGSVGITLSDVVAASIDNTLVRDTQGDADGSWGQGINVQLSAQAPITFEHVSVRGAGQSGIAVLSSEVTLTSVEVRDSAPTSAGFFGDGLLVMTVEGGPPGLLNVQDALVQDSGRASLAIFGATANLSDTHLACGALAIDGETWGDLPPSIVDGGGVRCGCEQDETCKMTSAQLAPPSPLQDEPSGG